MFYFILLVIVLWLLVRTLRSDTSGTRKAITNSRHREREINEDLDELIFPIRDIENQNFNHRLRSGFFKGYIKPTSTPDGETIEIYNESGLLLGYMLAGPYYHELLKSKYNGILPVYGYTKYNSHDKYWHGKIIAPYNIDERDTPAAFRYFERLHQYVFK